MKKETFAHLVFASLGFRRLIVAVCAALLSIFIPVPGVHAQTFSAIYNFAGGELGAIPYAGVTMDLQGNLYGVTYAGGRGSCSSLGFTGCGTVFKLTKRNSQWLYSELYVFAGGRDGAGPLERVIMGPNGSLYGTTSAGGGGVCASLLGLPGCGTVFDLQPPLSVCEVVSCPWRETQLYVFQGSANGGSDGAAPDSEVVFDQVGNLYGVTYEGGSSSLGTVYELSPSGGAWTKDTIWNFTGGIDQSHPESTLVFDAEGNLYGTVFGNPGNGAVFELAPTGSGWAESTLYSFQNASDGEWPISGVIFDERGNLYGASANDGSGAGGTAFQLTPLNQGWEFNLLYSFTGPVNYCGSEADLVIDAAGNLYGTTYCDGQFQMGSVFELSPSNGGWTYRTLHDFQGGTSDGAYPVSNLVLDDMGNLYGTASQGGAGTNCTAGCGVVFKITP